MKSKWEYKEISQISDVVTDYVANGSFASLKQNVTYLNSNGYAVLIRLTDYNKNFSGDFTYVNKNGYNFLKKTKLYGGELIISNVGANVGSVFLAPPLDEKMTLGPNSIMLKTKYNDLFYYYWFKSAQGQHALKSIVSGSAQPKFNKTDFKKLKVPVPSIDEQNRIANFLACFDKKIELNNQINKTLENNAKALFKRWFVDFEFPDENGTPYKSSGCKMVNSEREELPEGWEIVTLDYYVEIKYGKDHKKLAEGEYPVYGSGGIMRYVDKFLYSGESVLVPRKGTLNNVIYVDEPFWSVDTMFYTVMKKSNIAKFVYLFLNEIDLKSMNVGSAVPSMTTNILNNMKIIKPPSLVLEQFDSLIAPMFEMIKHKKEENNTLEEIRDAFLPKLLSVEIGLRGILDEEQ